MWTEFEIVLTGVICSFVTASAGYFVPGGFAYSVNRNLSENVTLESTGLDSTENHVSDSM